MTPTSQSSSTNQSASRQRIGIRRRVQAYLEHHQWVAVETLQQLLKQPIASALTWMVIAIALTLPGILWVAVDNLSLVSERLQTSASMSVYFQPKTTLSDVNAVAQQVSEQPNVAEVQVVSAADGLAQLQRSSDVAGAIELLDENPLPHLMVVEPKLGLSSVAATELIEQLQQLPRVDSVDADNLWLERLHAFLALAHKVVWMLWSLLGLAIVLVVGNTIRLTIATRMDEIRVMTLVGATKAWIRRPFLYMGIWYGAIGALISWIMLISSWVVMSHALDDLTQLYGVEALLQPLSAGLLVVLLMIAILLGWLGAFWSVHRHINSIGALD